MNARFLIGLLVAAVPALVLVVDRGGSVPLALLCITGIFVSVRHRSWHGLGRPERWVIAAFIAYCLVSVFGAAYGDWNQRALDKLSEHLRLLQFVPIYLLLRHTRMSITPLWIGLMIGAIGAGISAGYEVVWLGNNRAVGANNAIHFGNISIIMGVASLGAIHWAARKGALFWRVLPWLALAAGVIACLWSGTRGAMLFIPVGLILAGVYFWRALSMRAKSALVAAPLVAGALVLATPNSPLLARLDQAVDNVAAYEPGGARSHTSVGQRLDMWITSATAIAAHPLWGVGLGRFQEIVRPYVESGAANPEILIRDHPHNAYLSAQLSRGILGTLTLLGVLGLPLLLGLKSWVDPRPSVREWAYPLVIIAAGYAVHALTNNVFERGLSLSFFVFGIATALAGLYNASQASDA